MHNRAPRWRDKHPPSAENWLVYCFENIGERPSLESGGAIHSRYIRSIQQKNCSLRCYNRSQIDVFLTRHGCSYKCSEKGKNWHSWLSICVPRILAQINGIANSSRHKCSTAARRGHSCITVWQCRMIDIVNGSFKDTIVWKWYSNLCKSSREIY